MTTRKPLTLLLTATLAGALGGWAAPADDPPKAADPGTLVVIDSAGKEQKLKTWTFSAGVRRLAWLAPAGKDPKDKGPKDKKALAGPEALEFRDEASTNFVKGVLTFVPLDRLRAIDFDNAKNTMTVRVATGPKADADEVLKGTTEYEQFNKLAIAAEVDRGEKGIAELKFLGGVKGGIRGVRFPPPKAAAAAAGRPASITLTDKAKSVLKVTDLQPLYQFEDDSERLLPTLLFKKTLKLEMAKMEKIVVGGGVNDKTAWQVKMQGEDAETLTLLLTASIDGKPAAYVGLLGRVPAGYKLFPAHTIATIDFAEKPKE
jgi:hypothetical protein